MGSINVMLSWSFQKNMALVHVDDITSNRILIVSTNEYKNLIQIRYLDTWALFDPSIIVRMSMWLRI